MKRVFIISNVFKPTLLITILFFTVFKSDGQQPKPTASGYAPVDGIKVYYEVYGKGKPIVRLLHGAYYTIEMNWGELIPELAKTRKVIAIELQGNGHTPFSERKIYIVNLATDVEGVLKYKEVDSADVAGYKVWVAR